MATGSSLTQNYSRSQSEIQGDLHNIREPMNLKPTYVLILFAAESCTIAGYDIITRNQTRGIAGCLALIHRVGGCPHARFYAIRVPIDASSLEIAKNYSPVREIPADGISPAPLLTNPVAVIPKCIDNPPVDHDRLNAHPGSTGLVVPSNKYIERPTRMIYLSRSGDMNPMEDIWIMSKTSDHAQNSSPENISSEDIRQLVESMPR
ncbi:hypothetical protein TNCV_3278951 [Trichonephila clavipes]|nr:hypothetical protein TNCV_3278951 [Trichonephila clavipes]